MENAVKALRMAGGVLIAMIVVGLIVMGVNRLSNVKRTEEESLWNEELEKFNRSFESYNTDVVSGYKLISLANMAYDTNLRYSDNPAVNSSYKQVKIYASFLNEDIPAEDGTPEKEYLGYDYIVGDPEQKGTIPAQPKGDIIKVGNNKQYYNMIGYVNNGYGPYYELASDTIRKKFRDKYFTCISTQYDEGKDTAYGRVILMAFDEIKKKS